MSFQQHAWMSRRLEKQAEVKKDRKSVADDESVLTDEAEVAALKASIAPADSVFLDAEVEAELLELDEESAIWRGPVRFGLPDVAPFVLPLLWMVVEQLSDHATGNAVDAATTGIGTRVRAMIGRRRPADPTVSPVDSETLRCGRRCGGPPRS